MNKKMKQMIAYAMIGMTVLGYTPVHTMAVSTPQAKTAQSVQAVQLTGTTYYVDATNGEDTNEGTSPTTAWKSLDKINETVFGPGDQILFKSGEIWSGGIQPQGSGSKGEPIVINSYTYEDGKVTIGEGQKPILNGDGKALNTIWLNNVEFWEIKNLEITNKGEMPLKGRTGILVTADREFGREEDYYMEHIYLQGVEVHDVNGDLTTKDFGNAGINFCILEDRATDPVVFKDILVEDCYVRDVSRTGISVGPTKCGPGMVGSDISLLPQEELAKKLHQDVVIRNNYIERSGGDAIVPAYCYEPVIEYNVSQEASISTDGNPNLMYNAAIWPWKCYKGTFQYNEAFDTYLNGDGQAFDCDWSWGTTYQYNYSHNNEGGFMLVCLENTVDSIIRYNISQNDQRSLFMTSNTRPAYIYNNTMYIGEGLNTSIFSNHYGPLEFYNNIFYTEGTRKTQNWHEKNAKYDSNLFYGFDNTPEDANKVIADPLFKAPGTGGQGTLEKGPALDSLHGYELQVGSPAINAGRFMSKDRLPAIIDPVTKDFYDNAVGNFTVDLGAIDTMTKDVRPISDTYTINHQDQTITQVPVRTKLSKFMKAIAVDEGVTVELTQGEGVVTKGYVEAGMVLTTQIGDQTLSYTIGELVDNGEEVVATTTLEAPVTVESEAVFDVKVGLEAVQDVYAQDLTVTYDQDLFEFQAVNGEGNTQVIQTETTLPGSIRILSMTERGLTGMEDLLTMRFKAKEVAETVVGDLNVTEAVLGTVVAGESTTLPAATSQTQVTVQAKPPIITTPGDVNGDEQVDVADLALVAYYYQAKVGDDNWEQAKCADVIEDGKVDIQDLTFVATKILQK